MTASTPFSLTVPARWGDMVFNAHMANTAYLDLGAETPEEIALAIVSEIQSVFAEAGGESLRDRRAPIHGWNLIRTPGPAQAEECAASTP